MADGKLFAAFKAYGQIADEVLEKATKARISEAIPVPLSRFAPFVALVALIAACTTTPEPPKSTDPAVIARCRDLMYIGRLPRGPPNWAIYDRCLRGLPNTW
ncbi:MAG: hypothetical protein ABWY12_05110 [Burkholderiales bacterium]